MDPIEKKPLFHFLPGSLAFSIATAGYNFHCPFCQNWTIAQAPRMHPERIPGETTAPEDIVRTARRVGDGRCPDCARPSPESGAERAGATERTGGKRCAA